MRHVWRNARGVTVVELGLVVAILAAGIGAVVPFVERALPASRAGGMAHDLYGALHLTKASARATGVMHALVIANDGRSFRIVEDPAGAARTVFGPTVLVDGAVASGNTTIRFSPKGFAVPFGTITVKSEREMRRLIVNIVGRIRMDYGTTPP